MEPNTCIYTGEPFEKSSREHILQASFGARWDSDTLICQEMQERFSGAIDNAVADGIFQLRSLFGTKNGRGKAPLPIKEVPALDGTKYTLQAGMQPMLAKATYKIEHNPDGTVGVQFVMSDERQLPELLARFRRENPGLKFDEPKLEDGIRSQSYVEGPLHLQIMFGGRDFFRGILKSAFNLLGVNRPDIAQDPGFAPLKRLIVEDSGDTDEFVRWAATPEELLIERLGLIDHTLAVWYREGTVFGLLEMFGDIPFLLKLGEGITSADFLFGYSVNPLRDTTPAENRSPGIDTNSLPAFADLPAKPAPEIWKAFGDRVSRVMRRLQELGTDARIKQIVEDVLFPHEGKVFTKEMAEELSERMREFIEHLVGSKMRR